MARNGSGTYTKPVADFVNGTTISETAMNTLIDDIADALTGSIAKDGQTVWTGTDDHNGQKIILDADADTSITADTDDRIDIEVEGVDTVKISNGSMDLISTSDGATGYVLDLHHDSATPANNDIVAQIRFQGDDSAGGITDYVTIQGIASVVTSESERGQFKVTAYGASSSAVLTLDNSSGFAINYSGHSFEWVAGALELSAGLGVHGTTPPAQASHIADPSGGATVDSEARSAINAILVVLENIGFVAAS